MINQLVQFGESIREINSHNALKLEAVSIQITIDTDGSFLSIENFTKQKILTESIQRTSGKKARFLVDKSDYVLGFTEDNEQTPEQNQLFIEKLREAGHIEKLQPVILFYTQNAQNGIQKLTYEIFSQLKDCVGNCAFRVVNVDHFVAEEQGIIQFITNKYNAEKRDNTQEFQKCSVCGKSTHAIPEIHDKVKGVPKGQSSGTALISFNAGSFESYGLERNCNASICEQCAKNYVDGLNYLLAEGVTVPAKEGKKEYKEFYHRKRLSDNSCMIFWLKDKPGVIVPEILAIENPSEADDFFLEMGIVSENPQVQLSDFKRVANAPTGSELNFKTVQDDMFYAAVISGESARIAVRSWVETSAQNLKANVMRYFDDIKIYSSFAGKSVYSPIYFLQKCCIKDSDDEWAKTIGSALWNAALDGRSLPVSLLQKILQRIQVDMSNPKVKSFDKISSPRAALIKLLLNRHPQGGYTMTERLDSANKSCAYNAGRIFAVLERIQYYAQGEVNAGIRDRFFTSASTTPATAFGRLMKLSQNHLSKLSKEEPGKAIYLDKMLTGIFSAIVSFPALFTLEEQGQFAIGYYHQREELFSKNDDKNKNIEGEENE